MDADFILSNAYIIDGSGKKPYTGHIHISDNLIKEIYSKDNKLQNDIEEIDIKGMTIMPGLIDAHCHISFDEPVSNDELFFHRREGLASIIAGTNAYRVLQSGCTSFFDADSLFDIGVDLRDAIESGIIPGPKMAVGGNALWTSAGGTAGRLIPDQGKRGYGAVVSTPEEIVFEVRRQIKLGVDWIKIHLSGMVPRQKTEYELKAWSLDELKLAVDTAHELGIPVVAHARGPDSVRDGVKAGIDMILHGTYMDEEGLELMLDKQVPLVPTLTFQANLIDYAEEMGASDDYKKIFEKEIEDNIAMFRKAYDSGVKFMCGSESGFSVTPYGDWHWKELEVFVNKLGLNPLEAITCATKNAASALKRESDLGQIQPGFVADLIVIDGDPSKDISVLGKKDLLKKVFQNGREVDLTPLPSRSKDPSGWRVASYSSKILGK